MEEGTSSLPPIPILMTVRELDQGGIERDVSRIAMNLDRSRFAPHVASYHDHGMRAEDLRKAGVPLLHLPVRSLASAGTAKLSWELIRYIRRHKIRLVHAWDTTAVFVLPVARLAGVSTRLTSLLGSRLLLDPRSHSQWRWSDGQATGYIVNCEAMRKHWIEDEGLPASARVELCYNGVDTNQFFPGGEAIRPEGLGNAPLVIGAICALRPEKALDLLQEAFAQVRGLLPGIKLLLVGSGAELPKLVANAERLGITNDTVFVPATSAVAGHLRSIDIFVLSSHSEAFSNALLEAMASGCCPVGSRVGGTPEMIGANEERGLLFPAGDSQALAERLAKLIRNPELRLNLAQRAADYTRQHLNLQANVQRTQDIYESFLTP